MLTDLNSVILEGRAEMLTWQEDQPAIRWSLRSVSEDGSIAVPCHATGRLASAVREAIAEYPGRRSGRGRALRVCGRIDLIGGSLGVLAEHVEMKPVAR